MNVMKSSKPNVASKKLNVMLMLMMTRNRKKNENKMNENGIHQDQVQVT